MIWFFEREQNRLQYEIRRQPDGHAYELVITHPDGHQDIERYPDPVILLERASALRHTLASEGWQPHGRAS